MSSSNWTYAESPDTAAKARGEGFLAIRHTRTCECRIVLHGPSRSALADAAHEVDRGLDLRGEPQRLTRANWTGRPTVEVPTPKGAVVVTGLRLVEPEPSVAGEPCGVCLSPNTEILGDYTDCVDCGACSLDPDWVEA